MPAKTLTISLSEDDFNFLKKDDLLSPSKIFKVAMLNIKLSREGIQEENQTLKRRLFILENFITENHLIKMLHDWEYGYGKTG